MKWKMGVENIESVLEKIRDLHDKLSDAIHSTSRTHFLNSIRSHKSRTINGDVIGFPKRKLPDNDNKNGFVYFKDISGVVDVDCSAAVQEAKSLNAIRSALENLEDQLEFFKSIERQWESERDGAIARIEESRVIVATLLAEHSGKKYDVIKEARAFVVGDIICLNPTTSRLDFYQAEEEEEEEAGNGNGNEDDRTGRRGRGRGRRNEIVNALKSSLNYVRTSLNVDCIGNAAMVAITMFALMHFHFHQVGGRGLNIVELELPNKHLDSRIMTRVNQVEDSSLNVLLGRG